MLTKKACAIALKAFLKEEHMSMIQIQEENEKTLEFIEAFLKKAGERSEVSLKQAEVRKEYLLQLKDLIKEAGISEEDLLKEDPELAELCVKTQELEEKMNAWKQEYVDRFKSVTSAGRAKAKEVYSAAEEMEKSFKD